MDFLRRVFTGKKKSPQKQEVWRRDSFTEVTRTKRKHKPDFSSQTRSKSTQNQRQTLNGGNRGKSSAANRDYHDNGFQASGRKFYQQSNFEFNTQICRE